MSMFSYTATRELSPGTTALDVVDRDFRVVSRQRKREAKRKQNTALGGATETLLFRSEISYRLKTELIEPESQLEKQIVEFLASVEGGEQFNFDRLGTVAVPVNSVSCVMVSKSFTEIEEGKKYHRYGFVIREK